MRGPLAFTERERKRNVKKKNGRKSNIALLKTIPFGRSEFGTHPILLSAQSFDPIATDSAELSWPKPNPLPAIVSCRSNYCRPFTPGRAQDAEVKSIQRMMLAKESTNYVHVDPSVCLRLQTGEKLYTLLLRCGSISSPPRIPTIRTMEMIKKDEHRSHSDRNGEIGWTFCGCFVSSLTIA